MYVAGPTSPTVISQESKANHFILIISKYINSVHLQLISISCTIITYFVLGFREVESEDRRCLVDSSSYDMMILILILI